MTAGRKNTDTMQNWSTPENYLESVRAVFGGKIDLDPCSNGFSIVRAVVEYRLPKQDGLKLSWDFPTIYVNPPYGADRTRGTTIRHWLSACADAHRRHGSEVLALVPVATNTRHWKDSVFGVATSVAFLYDTRLKFLVDGTPSEKGAPMSCAMVYWGKHLDRFTETFLKHGAPVDLVPLQTARPTVQTIPSRKVKKTSRAALVVPNQVMSLAAEDSKPLESHQEPIRDSRPLSKKRKASKAASDHFPMFSPK